MIKGTVNREINDNGDTKSYISFAKDSLPYSRDELPQVQKLVLENNTLLIHKNHPVFYVSPNGALKEVRTSPIIDPDWKPIQETVQDGVWNFGDARINEVTDEMITVETEGDTSIPLTKLRSVKSPPKPKPKPKSKGGRNKSGRLTTERIVTREQAIEDGLSYYYIEKICKRGHKAIYRVTNNQCMDCHDLLVARRKAKAS